MRPFMSIMICALLLGGCAACGATSGVDGGATGNPPPLPVLSFDHVVSALRAHHYHLAQVRRGAGGITPDWAAPTQYAEVGSMLITHGPCIHTNVLVFKSVGSAMRFSHLLAKHDPGGFGPQGGPNRNVVLTSNSCHQLSLLLAVI